MRYIPAHGRAKVQVCTRVKEGESAVKDDDDDDDEGGPKYKRRAPAERMHIRAQADA